MIIIGIIALIFFILSIKENDIKGATMPFFLLCIFSLNFFLPHILDNTLFLTLFLIISPLFLAFSFIYLMNNTNNKESFFDFKHKVAFSLRGTGGYKIVKRKGVETKEEEIENERIENEKRDNIINNILKEAQNKKTHNKKHFQENNIKNNTFENKTIFSNIMKKSINEKDKK